MLAPICTPWGSIITTTLTPEEQRAEWAREQTQAETDGAAEQQSGEAAATDDAEAGDEKVESEEDGKAGKDKDAAAVAAEAGQSDRTSGAYRLLYEGGQPSPDGDVAARTRLEGARACCVRRKEGGTVWHEVAVLL